MADRVINVKIAGLGGMGVLKASDMLADAAFRAGLDVKKSEVHGMAQRGGSISSDVRFGARVLSPMIPDGESDFLVVLAADQTDVHRAQLKQGGVLIEPADVDESKLENPRCLNVAALGVLSRHLEIPETVWLDAVRAALPQKLHAMNEKAFALGRGGT